VPASDGKHRRKQQGISNQFRHRINRVREKGSRRQGKKIPVRTG
jgi:hypothetical protein